MRLFYRLPFTIFRSTKRSIVMIVLLMSVPAMSGYAQALWTGVTLRGKITKSLRADLEQQVRFNEVIGDFSNTFTELSLRFRPTDHVGVQGAYRYTNRPGSSRPDDNDRQRWSGDVFYNLGSKETQWVFSHRIRFQTAREQEAVAEEDDGDRKDYLRNRFGLAYNLTKRVQPYVNYEWFYRLNDKNEIRQHRLTMGLETQIGGPFGLDVFFRIDTEKNVKYPEKVYIIGVGGTYQIDFRKKADDDEPLDFLNN